LPQMHRLHLRLRLMLGLLLLSPALDLETLGEPSLEFCQPNSTRVLANRIHIVRQAAWSHKPWVIA